MTVIWFTGEKQGEFLPAYVAGWHQSAAIVGLSLIYCLENIHLSSSTSKTTKGVKLPSSLHPQVTALIVKTGTMRRILPSKERINRAPVPNITIKVPRLNPVIAACEACRHRKVKVRENLIVAETRRKDD